MNQFFQIKSFISGVCEDKEKGLSSNFTQKSLSVAGPGLEPGTS